MENNYLDKAVKDKLQHLEVEYQADTWNMLEQKLAVAEDATTLDDTALDGMVATALDDYEVPYEESNWDMMSQRLDDNLIDATVFGALQSIESPYEESNWDMMSQRLDVIFARPLQIIRYKLAELAFLFLLIFGVGEFIPAEQIKADTNTPVAESKLEKTNLEVPQNIVPSAIPGEPSTFENKQESLKSSDKKINQTALSPSNANSTTDKKAVQKKANTTTITQKEGVLVNEPSVVLALKTKTSNKKEIKQTSKTRLPIATDATSIVENNEKIIETENNLLVAKAEAISTIESLEQKVIETLNPMSLLESDIPFLDRPKNEEDLTRALLKITPKKKAQLRIGMFGSANMDYIFTPDDPILQLDAYSRYAPGYGGGVSIGWKYKRWEVETSIAYMSKRYKNRPFVHIYGGSVIEGYQGNALTGIELNNVNIPLHLNYHIVNSGKWRLYGLTGGTMQIVLQANYDANRDDLGGGQGPAFSGGTKVSEDNSRSIFNLKNFNDGFLADRNLKENSYYSLDIGMGLERYISPYWNVFIQPTFQYNLPESINTKGLGPNNDNINSLLFLIGIKSNLK